MKLILCNKCFDVFKLDRKVMRSCKCGKAKGRYLNNTEAEVSEGAVSLAIGNGALMNAVIASQALFQRSNGQALREEYYQQGNGLISHAWVRPNEGSGNPHCRIIKEDNNKKI